MESNWNDIRYFLILSRTQSFVAAADHLKVTHSTVSRRISALEETLQTTLFVRTGKGCRLTAEGEQLLPLAEQLEKAAVQFQAQVFGQDNKLSGTIRIGTPDGLGNCFLAPRLEKHLEKNPELEIELIAVPMYFSLSKREVDILISLRKPTTHNVIGRRITRYRFGLFASPAYLQKFPPIVKGDQLQEHRFVGYIDDLMYDQRLRFLEEFTPGLTTCFRSSTIIAQMNAIKAGAGIGVLPYFMAHTEPTLVAVLPELYIEREFWLQVNPDTRQLARVRATINFIVAEMEAHHAFFHNPQSAVIS